MKRAKRAGVLQSDIYSDGTRRDEDNSKRVGPIDKINARRFNDDWGQYRKGHYYGGVMLAEKRERENGLLLRSSAMSHSTL